MSIYRLIYIDTTTVMGLINYAISMRAKMEEEGGEKMKRRELWKNEYKKWEFSTQGLDVVLTGMLSTAKVPLKSSEIIVLTTHSYLEYSRIFHSEIIPLGDSGVKNSNRHVDKHGVTPHETKVTITERRKCLWQEHTIVTQQTWVPHMHSTNMSSQHTTVSILVSWVWDLYFYRCPWVF